MLRQQEIVAPRVEPAPRVRMLKHQVDMRMMVPIQGTMITMPAGALGMTTGTMTSGQRFLKRLFDILMSLTLLLLTSPILLLIAAAIKMDSPGPIFFRQDRIGQFGIQFKMLKFRTMCQDAEQRWKEVARRDANGQLMHKSANDPRVTRVGSFLRKTSLDELPQMVNVLLGQMSLVGPRPEMPYIAAEYEAWQWQRFAMPGGITGWWQVNGRSDKPMHLNTADDLYYIQNYSFWLDLKILCLTIITVLKGRGAY